MRGLLLLANGFEDVEALATRDILVRGGLEIIDASINDSLDVLSSHKVIVKADRLLKDIDINEFDFLILPGGGLGVQNLLKSALVDDVVHAFMKNNHLVCAICAAPMVLGKLGYLKGRNYTCFAGCNEGLIGNYTAKEVEIDGNIITGRSMKYSVVFGLTILEKVAGLEIKNKVATAIDGL